MNTELAKVENTTTLATTDHILVVVAGKVKKISFAELKNLMK